MDYHQENEFSSGTTVKVLSGNLRKNGSHENWEVAAEWATEDDYRMFNNEPYADSNSSYEARSSQYLSGSSEPPSKRSRLSQSADPTALNRSKAIGKMFYKTKLCCKFRIGTCPYITNCNFAHSIEELRNPPPNWQEIVVGAHDDEPREEYQIPSLGVSDERSYKGRHCKKFYTEEGCPYGEACTFLHDEQSRDRESVVISLGPSSGGNNASQPVVKASNWKTRICNKWDLTGYCPFGSKCHFAHGATELYPYGGGPIDSDVNDSSMPNGKQGDLPAKTSMDAGFGSHAFVPHTDGYHKGYPSQRLSSKALISGQRSMQKWKGPDKISKIYGDWIDDL